MEGSHFNAHKNLVCSGRKTCRQILISRFMMYIELLCRHLISTSNFGGFPLFIHVSPFGTNPSYYRFSLLWVVYAYVQNQTPHLLITCTILVFPNLGTSGNEILDGWICHFVLRLSFLTPLPQDASL